MDEKIFRQESIDRISSPDELNDYLKVSTPNLWIALIASIILLIGCLVWACQDTLETKIETVASVSNHYAQIVLTGSDAEAVEEKMDVRIGDVTTKIDHLMVDDFDRVIAVFDTELPDGNYKAQIILESIHPIQILFR